MVFADDVLAVVLASGGAIMHAIGYIVQKKGHIYVNEYNSQQGVAAYSSLGNEHTPAPPSDVASNPSDLVKAKPKSFVSNLQWVSGFVLYILGSLLAAVALNFGAQSVVAPLGSLTLVCNTILAAKFLGEPFERHHLVGIVVVIVASILLVVFGPNENEDISLDEFKANYIQPGFVIFALVLTGLAIWTYSGVKYYEMLNEAAGNKNDVQFGRRFLMISYVSLAAYFGSLSVLFIKSGVLMLFNIDSEIATDWFFYFILTGCVVVNLALEYFRQRALACFGAMFVVPIYQVLYIIGAALFGAVYFGEFSSLELYEFIMFTFAIFLTLIGVMIIAFDVGEIQRKIKKRIAKEMIECFECHEMKVLSPESTLLYG